MLSPASIRMRVFSVASRAAFPELPLARTQNLTVAASLDTSEYTESSQNSLASECLGTLGAGGHRFLTRRRRDAEKFKKPKTRTWKDLGCYARLARAGAIFDAETQRRREIQKNKNKDLERSGLLRTPGTGRRHFLTQRRRDAEKFKKTKNKDLERSGLLRTPGTGRRHFLTQRRRDAEKFKKTKDKDLERSGLLRTPGTGRRHFLTQRRRDAEKFKKTKDKDLERSGLLRTPGTGRRHFFDAETQRRREIQKTKNKGLEGSGLFIIISSVFGFLCVSASLRQGCSFSSIPPRLLRRSPCSRA